MPDWKIQHIRVNVEYAVKAIDTQDNLIFDDPAEFVLEFPAQASVEVIDPATDVSGRDIIFALSESNGNFTLFRFDDEARYDFEITGSADVDPRLIRGAVKVSFTNLDTITGVQITDTLYYPVAKPQDRQKIPPGVPWRMILERIAPGQYQLLYVAPVGAGPVDKCTRLNCQTTVNPYRRRKCANMGCYNN